MEKKWISDQIQKSLDFLLQKTLCSEFLAAEIVLQKKLKGKTDYVQK